MATDKPQMPPLNALALIAEGGCEYYTHADCYSVTVWREDLSDYGPRTPDAVYAAEGWCHPCIAAAGLRGGS